MLHCRNQRGFSCKHIAESLVMKKKPHPDSNVSGNTGHTYGNLGSFETTQIELDLLVEAKGCWRAK